MWKFQWVSRWPIKQERRSNEYGQIEYTFLSYEKITIEIFGAFEMHLKTNLVSFIVTIKSEINRLFYLNK